MSFSDSKRSLEKALEVEVTSVAGNGERESLEQSIDPSAPCGDEANVGLHEFDIARQSGLRVTPEQSRR